MATTQEIVDRFPAFATMMQIPEVEMLLQKAAAEKWSSAYFQQQLWATDWWKQTPETARTWQARQLVDPATAGQQQAQMGTLVGATATSLGIHLTGAENTFYTALALNNGWDAKELTRQLVDNTARDRFKAGAVKAQQQDLEATARSYGINLSSANTFKWAKQIADGHQTSEGFQSYIRTQAKAAFPHLGNEIDAGLTVRQLADPYMQIAGQMLGLNPDEFDITKPKWTKALQGKDSSGKIVGPMTYTDWQREVMTNAAYGWDHSANAKDAAYSLRTQLAETFGNAA